MLVTNIATYVLILLLLTVVPMLPGMVMSRYLSTGLAKDRAARAQSAMPLDGRPATAGRNWTD